MKQRRLMDAVANASAFSLASGSKRLLASAAAEVLLQFPELFARRILLLLV